MSRLGLEEEDQQDLSSLVETAKDHLTCIVCMDFATEPVLFKCCGRISCKSCLHDWLAENHTCPFCRSAMFNDDDVIPVPWANGLSRILATYFDSSEGKRCPKHNKPYEFVCETCHVDLCSECIFEELTSHEKHHEQHEILSIRNKLDNIKGEIKNVLKLIDNDIQKIVAATKKLQDNSTTIEQQKSEISLEMYTQFKELQDKIERKFAASKEFIQNKTDEFEKLINECVGCINGIEIATKRKKSEIIAQQNEDTDKLIEKVKSTDMETVLEKIYNPFIPEFHQTELPVTNFREKVRKYKEISDDTPQYIYSERIYIGGNTWRAKIYPNGNGNGLNTHLSVFVELTDGPSQPTPYQYKIEIPAVNPTYPAIWKQYSSIFKIEDSWGWNKVASLAILQTNDYIREDGTLLLLLSIRATSYFQMHKDMKAAMEKVDAKQLVLTSMIEESDK